MIFIVERTRKIKAGILLIGFNRPSFLQERLKVLEDTPNLNATIYVSIDGPRDGNPEDMLAINQIRQALEKSPLHNSITIWFSQSNRGCDLHIYDSINKALSVEDHLVVIEDDIAMSASAIVEILAKSELIVKSGLINPIVAMSGVSRKIPFLANQWRNSRYFSAWGFALNREFWMIHKKYSDIKDESKVIELLKESEYWAKLSKRRKGIWLERFSRPNYDYGIQRTIFFENLFTISPFSRVSDNLGHGVQGASHTRFRTPWFIKLSVAGRVESFAKKHNESRVLNSLIGWMDSQTWAGDGLLSVRGRTYGIRTILRGFLDK